MKVGERERYAGRMPQEESILLELDEQIRAQHSALVIVDMQNDFVHPQGWVAQQAMPAYLDSAGVPGALEACSRLLEAARAAGVLRFFVRMLGDDKYLSPAVRAQYQRLQGEGRPSCVLEGSWGAKVHDALAPRPDDPEELLVDKYRYSAFAGTRLDLLARSHGIRTLVMCGVATSGCVESTTRDALFADYYAVTAADACADYDEPRHRNSLRKMDLSFGYVVESDRILSAWKV